MKDQRTRTKAVSATRRAQDRHITPGNYERSSNPASKTNFIFRINDLLAEREEANPTKIPSFHWHFNKLRFR